MNLDLLNDLFNKVKESDFTQKFTEELSNYLEKVNEEGKGQLEVQENNKNLDRYREENALYQVVDFSSKGVFLQNTNTGVTFEEIDIPQDILDKIGNDYILRYTDGKYVVEQELTEDFMNSMVGIQEYRKIKEQFEKESNILHIDANTRFNVLSRDNDYTMLSYGEKDTLKVPNALVPYFANEQSILCYKNGKFENA